MLPDLPPWPVYSEAERSAVARVLEQGLGNYRYDYFLRRFCIGVLSLLKIRALILAVFLSC